jgi:hypothetical protein
MSIAELASSASSSDAKTNVERERLLTNRTFGAL